MVPRDPKKTDVHTDVMFLGKLLEKVVSGKVRVPKFQRPYVWSHKDMISLLESILLGYPIGSILLWETDWKQISSLDRLGPISLGERPKGQISYVLDGNQRLSTLAGTLMLPEDYKGVMDGTDWRVYYDLEQEQFIHKPKDGLEVHHFPVRELLSTSGFLRVCRQIEEKLPDKNRAQKLVSSADNLANAMRNYQIPLIKVIDANLDSAVSVFARLNRRGRKMTADQMVSALTYREGDFNLAPKLDELQADLGRRGFKDLDRVLLLRIILAAMGFDVYAKDFADLLVKEEHRQKLSEGFEMARKGVMKALDFLAGLGVTSDRMLPYGLQLVLLAEFFRLASDEVPSYVKDLLERWFWVTSFTGWFGGVNTAQVRKALEEMRAIAKGNLQKFREVDLEATALPFPNRFDGRSARVRAYLLFLASLEPKSLYHDSLLRPGELLVQAGPSALAYLVAGGASSENRSSPANRLFVDNGHRGQAITTFEDLPLEQRVPIMESHGFPTEVAEDLSNLSRDQILTARLENLIEKERDFMLARGVTPSKERTGDTVRDSDTTDEQE